MHVEWTLIAETGERFTDFWPYVPGVDDAGRVCFQAALRTGGSGVFLWDGVELVDVAAPPEIESAISHPDLDARGSVTFYGTNANGADAVFVRRAGVLDVVTSTTAGFSTIGPLGPTMNADGAVAFRADPEPDVSAVFAFDETGLRRVADTTTDWSAFQGLPVIADDGSVVVRGERPDGTEAIVRSTLGGARTIVGTGGRFASLGRFPDVGHDGAIAFAATLAGGGDVVVVARGDALEHVDERGAYESFRGVLLAGEAVVRIATPVRGGLGLFAGPDPGRDRILEIGRPLFGSTVADLAANPVSVSATGYLAVRASLDDGRQVILRTRLC
jgi:hypothetical protein